MTRRARSIEEAFHAQGNWETLNCFSPFSGFFGAEVAQPGRAPDLAIKGEAEDRVDYAAQRSVGQIADSNPALGTNSISYGAPAILDRFRCCDLIATSYLSRMVFLSPRISVKELDKTCRLFSSSSGRIAMGIAQSEREHGGRCSSYGRRVGRNENKVADQ
jgi:hypothetical protein